jgi:TRAP-type C4-dicarboxylate transport system substrate-binding protein
MANPDSFRQMSSNIPVYELADFDGIKIRTMENKYHMAFWEELGATPTPLAFGELYIALQQGLVHAQENPYATLIASKLNEQQDYVLDTNHIMFLNTTSINQNVFNNLPEEYQNILTESFEEAREIAFEISREEDQKALDEVIEAGTEFIEVSDELRSEMQEAAQPVYEMIAEEIGQDSVDALFEAIEEVQ